MNTKEPNPMPETPSDPRPSAMMPPGVVDIGGKLGALSELEAALAGPSQQAHAAWAAASAQMADLASRTRLAMRAGCSPGHFQTLEAVSRACVAAEELLALIVPPGDQGATIVTGQSPPARRG